jgi:hypothetical protein
MFTMLPGRRTRPVTVCGRVGRSLALAATILDAVAIEEATSVATSFGCGFQFNTRVLCEFAAPAVALDTDGDWVVVSSVRGNSRGDTDGTPVQVQRYEIGDCNG